MIQKPVLLTVSQLNRYLKAKFEEDEHLRSVFLTGEISNFTNHYKSGHLYFSLKDETAAIKAVMFVSHASRLRFLPKDGMKVLARGRVSVYEASGQYQLYVEDLQPDGIGALNLAYEQMKQKLEKEGLFSPERKKPIPKFPERIGVITSPTGAAVRDIQQILARRYPLAKVILAPVLVQGENAAPQIVNAIERFNALDCADVLIVGRGGGSIEDLWAFNEESVARAVAASHIPVISAVGHETDFTICDFVADLRAPTPSAAAELAVPDRDELLEVISSLQYTMEQLLRARLLHWKQQLDELSACRYLSSPEIWLTEHHRKLDTMTTRLSASLRMRTAQEQGRLSALAGKLDGLSPLKVLERGFVYATDSTGKLLTDVSETAVGDALRLRLRNGTVACTVTSVERMEELDESKHDV
ncbi:MAG: exodeoxyribonuclease VII large subunit [Oscillospiraceae bacterium]|nr:exodeoxyribonuclease VII large subunit [Oscillospiraceae bacterium]